MWITSIFLTVVAAYVLKLLFRNTDQSIILHSQKVFRQILPNRLPAFVSTSILNSVPDCSIHFVDVADIVNFEAVSSAVVISRIIKSDGEEDKYTEAEQVQYQYKLRHIICFTTLFMTGELHGDESLLDDTTGLADRYVWGLQGQVQIFQRFILFFAPASTFDAAIHISNLYIPFYASYSFSPVFVLLYGQQSNNAGYLNVESGLFVCTYCLLKDYSLHYFSCTPTSPHCYSEMIVAYKGAIKDGTSVYWNLGTNNEPTLSKESFYATRILQPLERKYYDHTLFNATISFLYSGLNHSSKGIPTGLDLNQPLNFEFYSIHDGSFGKFFKLVVTGDGQRFNFITSDGVQTAKYELGYYAIPTEPCVRILYVSLGVFIALAVALIGKRGKTEGKDSVISRIFMETCHVLSFFVDQNGVELKQRKSNCQSFSRILISSWMLSTIALSTFYKGMLNTSFSTSYPYLSEWSKLEELTNFSLFTSIQCLTENAAVLSESQLINLCYEIRLLGQIDNTCVLKQKIDRLLGLYRQEYPRTDANKKFFIQLNDMKRNLQVFCNSTLSTIIDSYLTQPKTALITSPEDFQISWVMFTDKMQMDEKLSRFSHNARVRDNFLQFPEGFSFSWVDEHHKKSVPKRLQVLLMSGIYNFWEKYDSVRFLRNDSRKMFYANHHDELKRDFVEVQSSSIRMVDIAVVFYLLVGLFCVCGTCLWCELVRFNFHKY